MAIRVWYFLVLSLVVPTIVLALDLAEADVPAIFIFGDSTADVGTNTYLNDTLAKADQPFNGIDYPYSRATGRFSNGYNAADLIARLMDSDYERSPPPFLSLLENMATFKRNLLKGVNFASGGSGILDDTGNKTFHRVISLGEQIQQFSTVRPNITDIVGADKADSLISKSVYLLSVGSNDMFDYQLYNSSNMSPDTFITTLLQAYNNHFKDLYNLGARKFGIVSVPPIGCCPFERLLNGTGGCFVVMNELAQTFYQSIQPLLQQFSLDFQGVKYSLGNAYFMTMNIIDNPLASGFEDIQTACCGNGTLNAQDQCSPSSKLCPNRDDYLFWDRFHPTQAAAQLAALTLYAGAQEFVTPMNFSQLALVHI
ncbi:GDSL esterase/lipase At4g28780-like [Actinidia eriantha]|uniref:GDSL esterase/lipase At4g28780-like n=1 Tax=Actinidia eriantha TaxID=165200 RepID=UPI00258D9FE4|nr:GDSL esterase/lipase At4g28780-like [Actinidia eriantha]